MSLTTNESSLHVHSRVTCTTVFLVFSCILPIHIGCERPFSSLPLPLSALSGDCPFFLHYSPPSHVRCHLTRWSAAHCYSGHMALNNTLASVNFLCLFFLCPFFLPLLIWYTFSIVNLTQCYGTVSIVTVHIHVKEPSYRHKVIAFKPNLLQVNSNCRQFTVEFSSCNFYTHIYIYTHLVK